MMCMSLHHKSLLLVRFASAEGHMHIAANTVQHAILGRNKVEASRSLNTDELSYHIAVIVTWWYTCRNDTCSSLPFNNMNLQDE